MSTARPADTAPRTGAMTAAPEPGAALPIEFEAFLTHLAVERGRSARTLSAYRRDLARLVAFCSRNGIDPLGATASDLRAYSSWLGFSGLAPSSRTRMLVTVRGVYRFCHTEGFIPDDPGSDLETPRRPDALPKALDRTEVEAILELAATAAEGGDPVALRDRALLEFLYGTGARVSEACGLGFGDIDMEASLVRLLGKRDKERMVPVGRPARRAVAEYLDRGRPAILAATPRARGGRDRADAIFLGVRGNRMSRQAVWEVLRRHSLRAGISSEVSPHVLRHSCATHMLEGGADIRIVAEMLGHASVSTTQIYTRVANDLLFEAYASAHPRAGRSLTGPERSGTGAEPWPTGVR
ncbi:MAG: tyrosine recombinase XerD [Microthrixaceae bacterium]|nr:tyrosine recombinase XerD [Microthrixaceae bacterium]